MVEKLSKSNERKYVSWDKLDYRMTCKEDSNFLKKWITKAKEWFPVETEEEVDVVVKNWVEYGNFGSAITVTIDGEPVAMSVLYLCPFQKLKHMCEISLIVSPEYRRMGIGSELLYHMLEYAKNQFKITHVHLHLYQGNSAKYLYDALKFEEYGVQENWICAEGKKTKRILMMKELTCG